MDPIFGAAVLGKIGYDQYQGHVDENRQKRLMKEQQKYTEKNMALAQQLQQADRQIAPLQSAEAMERAGLSSSLLTDGKFQLAGVTNTPGPSAPGAAYHASPLEISQMDNASAQSELLRAQAEKTKVETEEITEEQNAMDDAVRGWLTDVANDATLSDDVRNRATVMLESSKKIGRKTVEALQNFIQLKQNDRESILNQLDFAYQKKLKEMYLAGDFPTLEANGRKIDFEKKIPELAKLYAEEAYIVGQSKNLPSERSLNYAKVKEALANAQKTRDTDLLEIMRNPDDAAKLKELGGKVLEGGLMFLPVATGAKLLKSGKAVGKKIFDKGKAVVKKFTGRSGSKTVPISTTNSPRIPKALQKQLDDKEYVTQVMSRLPQKVRERADKEWRDRARFYNDKRSFADFLRDKSKEESMKNKRRR